MTDISERFFGIFAKWAPATTLAVAIACTIVIFLPETVAAQLGLVEFRTDYRGLLGWGFVLSWSSLGAALIWWLKSIIAKKFKVRKQERIRQQHLHELTPEEKGYLIEYKNGQNSIYCDIEDGIAGGLLAKDIIYRSSNVFNMVDGVPYNIQPWAKRYLDDHPELLDGYVKRRERSIW